MLIHSSLYNLIFFSKNLDKELYTPLLIALSIRMKWAAFEESVENQDEARNIISQLVAKYPMLLEAR